MSKISTLTISLIEDRPETAARGMGEVNPDDAADFLESLPTRHAVTVLSRSSASLASDLIPQMETASGAAILNGLDYQTTVSIMRMLDEADREKMLSALPKRLRNDLESTLSYPVGTVGAKMTTSIVIMKKHQTVADAIAELRRVKRSRTGIAFVVDSSRKLLGVISAGDLVQLPNESVLSAVMDISVVPISARSRLETVRSLSAWDDYAQLPVVSRKKLLIGALSRKTFRQAEATEPSLQDNLGSQSILASVASSFLASAMELLHVLTDAETNVRKPEDQLTDLPPGVTR